ncbi:MAG: HPr(Ser) kinase/phosphatase [Thermodesulfobacteriota bacterium]
MSGILVEELERNKEMDLGLSLMAGRKGLKRRITRPQVQKMGLALTGFTQFVEPERIQIIGNTEMSYFSTLPPERQREIIHEICRLELSCLVFTRNLDIPELLLEEADRKGIPVFRTHLPTTDFIEGLTLFLEEKLAATCSIHGVLMDVFGVGVLIMGKSGIGKSECALDLILRGHRLVADDMVYIQKRAPSVLIGSGFEIIQHHMEIRGLGIINIRSLFGVEAIRERKKIELVLELVEWDTSREYDRLGFEKEKYTILGVEIPMLKIPVTPARNLTTIIEVAARNHLLKVMGYDSAKEFEKNLLKKMEERQEEKPEAKGEVE